MRKSLMLSLASLFSQMIEHCYFLVQQIIFLAGHNVVTSVVATTNTG